MSECATYTYLIICCQLLIDLSYVFFVRERVVDAAYQFTGVGVIVQQHGIRLLAVTSCASGLLEICLYGVWAVVV